MHEVCNYSTPAERMTQVKLFLLNETSTESSAVVCRNRTTSLLSTSVRTAGQVIGHTQVQHSPNGDLLFLHQNCHKISYRNVQVGGPRTWQGIAWHVQSPDLLLSPRATVLANERGMSRHECRFRLNGPDGSADFLSVVPFDIERFIQITLVELSNRTEFKSYQRSRVIHYHDTF
jgi:hypothetical protein